ncbi:cysteine proteinase [Hortaea werneckii]|nr:cysteine proteinase [Hortaea werneckii]KAI6887643.1 cysteine proteinase [Hortaea werneckii]KAI6998397.1 cysteine proteinase [Hortaea werneckii]KAI7149154.1 cysteine proteinase [Hortaea werneckii]KAI7176374.1 cysteine proteinase [Hortaea werneckii]
MPLTKPAPSPSHSSRDSPSSGHRHSGSGFHPFGGRVSRHFGDSLSPDDAYLSYYDVRLTREDVDCIKDDWLTDNAIAFWEEYLEREKLGAYPKANIVLLRPSMAFLLLKTKDPLSLKSALPSFEKTTHIFLPVNDCRDVETAEGGSHWSLLLVSVIDGVAFHYDSLSPANMQEAKLIAHRISQLLGKPLKFINLDDSPQQENSMDCGVYVCLLMQHLLISRLLRAHSQDKITMSMRGKEVDASGGRKEMLRIIEARRKEGERRRSRSHSPYHAHNVHGSKSRSPPRIGEENEDAKKESFRFQHDPGHHPRQLYLLASTSRNMPAAKNSILGKLRKQGRAQNRGVLSASAHSAFAALTQRNEEHTTTTSLNLKQKDTDPQTAGQPDSTAQKRKRGKKAPAKKPRRKVVEEPETPVVECWRPAGGEQLLLAEGKIKSSISNTLLGVARVATWRVPGFWEGVEKLLEEEKVGFVELITEETVHGGESVTDVKLRFRDEGQAEMARGKLEGQMVGGRKLQVRVA